MSEQAAEQADGADGPTADVCRSAGGVVFQKLFGWMQLLVMSAIAMALGGDGNELQW
jgi:hypothetical protein